MCEYSRRYGHFGEQYKSCLQSRTADTLANMAREKISMSVKTFYEALEEKLAGFSQEDLLSVVRNIARDVAAPERGNFLKKLTSTMAAEAHVERILDSDDLLTDIEDLISEIRHKQDHAEEWEQDRWDYHDHYDDEDSLGPYEECVSRFDTLFDRTRGIFDCDNFALARKAYMKLFEALGMEDDYGRGVHASDLQETDIGEECSRYLRSVYEETTPAQRVQTLWKALAHMKQLLWRRPPSLTDIMGVMKKPLSDEKEFLRAWVAFLKNEKESRAEGYLREAIRLAEGTAGIGSFAKEYGNDHPRAYLDWVKAIADGGGQKDVIAAVREALSALPKDLPIRSAIADVLYEAASSLRDEGTMRDARLEAFRAKPELHRLLDLWESTPAAVRRERMEEAALHIAAYAKKKHVYLSSEEQEDDAEEPADVSVVTLAHAHLLAQDWEGARKLAASGKEALGWTYGCNPQGLVVPAFLYLLMESKDALTVNLLHLWNDALENSIGWNDHEADEKRMREAYRTIATEASFTPEERKRLLQWCTTMSRKRAEAIVGNKRRKSYDKAARVVCACADVLQACDKHGDADALVEDIRLEFSRHSSFQKELRDAVAQIGRKVPT